MGTLNAQHQRQSNTHAARGAFPSNKLAAERHALKRHSVPAPACRRRPAPES